MKKLKIILLIVAVLTGIYYFYPNEEKKYIEKDIYFANNKAYSIFTDREISGYVKSENYLGTSYREYNKGRVLSEKIVDPNLKMISKKAFDENGLLEGKSYIVMNGEGYDLEYKNNILNGKSKIKNNEIDFVDGTINGKNMLPQDSYSNLNKQITFKNGIPDFIELEIPTSEYPKKILVDEIEVPNKFTGGIIQTKSSEIILFEYVNGELTRERSYEGIYSLIGLKLKDTIYSKDKKINKVLNYRNGILLNLTTFNDKGEMDGVLFERDFYSDEFKIKNYKNGFLNGKTKKYYMSKDKKIQETSGIYNIGILSGQYLNYNKVENFLNGFKVNDLDLNKVLNDKEVVIESFKDIPKDFTGFNVDSIMFRVNEYKDGKIIREYTVNNNLETEVKEFKDNGGYDFNLYSSEGVIKVIREIDKKNVHNGKYVEYFYGGDSCTKTEGTMVNNTPLGRFVHYHGDKIEYVDIYHENNTYTRTYYKDYEKNDIDRVTTGKRINGIWVEKE